MTDTRYTPDRLFGKKSDDGITIIIFVILFVAVCLTVYSYFFAVIRVSGNSMLDTLENNQFILFRTHAIKINRNDIVTVQIDEESKVLIKRVVAIGGDKIIFMYDTDNLHIDLYICKKGETDFIKCDEPYIRNKMVYGDNFNDVKVCPNMNLTVDNAYLYESYCIYIPENCFYYLGDNRNISLDAREYGIREETKVLGKAFLYIKPGSFPDKLLNFYYNIFAKD